MKKYKYCFQCGAAMLDASYIYGYDQETGRELVEERGTCPKAKWYQLSHTGYPTYYSS